MTRDFITARTPRELIAQLQTLPPDVPLEFSPITSAWLGTLRPMRAGEISMYTADGLREATAEDVAAGTHCYAVLRLFEDRNGEA